MDIGPVMRPLALDAVMPVAPEGADALEPAGPLSAAPGTPAGQGLQSAALQTFARPHAPVLETLRPADTALAIAAQAGASMPAAAEPLVPVMLSALQVDAAAAWPLLRRGFDAPLPVPPRTPAEPPQDRRHDADEAPDPAPDERAEPLAAADDPAAGLAFEDPADTDWCAALTAALHTALAARIPPQPLLAAADQWRRGRCVVLACPQGNDPAGPAWAFVLWPQRTPRAGAAPLALRGLRVEARLQWSAPPDPGQWCHVRVVKEHHPRRGRQLVPLAPAGSPPACDVQLGPVLARSLRWCEVRVRIDAVRRFWAALGTQWSATVVVCARPLATPARLDPAETTC